MPVSVINETASIDPSKSAQETTYLSRNDFV